MPVLKNPKHERFAQHRLKGETVDQAYESAGYKPNRGNAARLNANESITARIKELQSKAAEKAEVTAADIAKQLDEDREFAQKNTHSSAAVSATMGKAKVLGLLSDKVKVQYENLGETEIDARLKSLESKHGHDQLAD